MDVAAAAPSGAISPVALEADLLATQRGLARREPPVQLLATLMTSLVGATEAAVAGVEIGTGRWVLPHGCGSTHRTRLERSRSAPTQHEWVIDVPIEDAGQLLGRLVLVLPNGPRAERSRGIGFDPAGLIHVLTMLLLSIASENPTASDRLERQEPGPEADTPVAASIRRDLAAGRFVPHFQPVVDLSTGHVAAFDALVRWNHPQRGWISAAEFFPQAKKAGLVAQLESVVFAQAALRARRWLDRGVNRVRVNVKVSGDRFESPELLAELVDLVRSHRLPPASLSLMVTESTLARASVVAALPSMRSAGFRITIEHFGTRPTLAASLRALPLYALKIDRSIVHRLGIDPAASREGRAVVQTASSLNLRTIGEGIETEVQRAELERLGCTAGQGFLWSPAVEGEVADSIVRFQTFAGRAARRPRLDATG